MIDSSENSTPRPTRSTTGAATGSTGCGMGMPGAGIDGSGEVKYWGPDGVPGGC
jgi:hypothetical protein